MLSLYWLTSSRSIGPDDVAGVAHESAQLATEGRQTDGNGT